MAFPFLMPLPPNGGLIQYQGSSAENAQEIGNDASDSSAQSVPDYQPAVDENVKQDASDLNNFSKLESLLDKLLSGFSPEQSTALMNQFAQQQFERNQASANKAMAFSSLESLKNRNWQEYMSNTSYQRAVKDLQAAGLNPVLATSGLNGATTPSGGAATGVAATGSAASVDTDKSYLAVFNTIVSALANLGSSALRLLRG